MAFEYTRTGLLSIINSWVQDSVGTAPRLSLSALGDIDVAIYSALIEISRSFETFAADPSGGLIAGDGTRVVSFSGVAPYFVDAFSVIKDIETPADEDVPILIDRRNWRIDRIANKVIFAYAIEPGQTIRARYTVPYTINGFNDETITTVPVGLWQPFGILCASYAMNELASFFVHQSESAMNADITSFTSDAAIATRAAKRLRDLYNTVSGISSESSGPKVGYVSLGELDTESREAYFNRARPGQY